MTVRLYIRVRLKDGRRLHVDPVYAANRKLKPLFAMVHGQAEHHPEGVYYLRYQRDGAYIWEAVGTDPQHALLKLTQRKNMLTALASGLHVVEPGEMMVRQRQRREPEDKGPRTADAIATYISDAGDYKAYRTYVSYRETLRLFAESCKKEHLKKIDRRDILNFIDHLRKRGNRPRTIANRVSCVLTFLRKQGFKDIIHPSDLPKYTEKIIKAYSAEQLKTLFEHADAEDKILFHFFLGSGCRDNEVVHAHWEDVDFTAKTYDVREKPAMRFQPKDHEERTIPLPGYLVEMLREHRQRHPHARLLFPGVTGERDNHLIRRLKKLALAAGLNCGRCESGKQKLSCAEHPVCAEWELHRFRKTFATMHAKAGVKIHDISRWCGHASVETTMTYLAASEVSAVDVRERVDRTFAQLGGAA